MQTIYEAAGGEAGLRRLAEAWHRRVLADRVVSHAFSHGFSDEHLTRLADYWTEALGGPAAWSARGLGESDVVRMHSGNGAHQDMDDRAVECFDAALADVGLVDEPLRTVLLDYFAWSTRTAMARFPDSADDVPDGMALPHWSWDGLQS